jgi:Rod binding domain-containing protein
MTFPPASPLKPLDLTRAARAGGTLRPIAAADLTRTGRRAAVPKTEHDQLVEQTRKWVGQTFFGTLLKQMHDSPFKSDLFSGGRGGEAFSSLHNQQLAERMARGAGSKLVHSIVRRIEAKAAYQKQQTEGAAAIPPAPAATQSSGARPGGRNTTSNGRRHVAATSRA